MLQHPDLAGRQYPSFEVVERLNNKRGYRYFLCKCKCGNLFNERGSRIINKQRKDCGCGINYNLAKAEKAIKRHEDVLQKCNKRYNDSGTKIETKATKKKTAKERITKYGYRTIRIKESDPLIGMANPVQNRNGSYSFYILEHRYVAARERGRALDESETVHHIDGDKLNNSPDNLQIIYGAHGSGQAMECKDCGSDEVCTLGGKPRLCDKCLSRNVGFAKIKTPKDEDYFFENNPLFMPNLFEYLENQASNQ